MKTAHSKTTTGRTLEQLRNRPRTIGSGTELDSRSQTQSQITESVDYSIFSQPTNKVSDALQYE